MNKKLVAGVGALLVVACGAFVLAPQALAAGRYGTDDSNFIKQGDTVDGAAYLAGNNVQIEGTVNGDVYCAAETITITGTVNGDINCAGASVKVSGKVTGDVRVAGNNVTLGGEIGGSATAFGSTVTVDTAARIGRDAVFGGRDVLVNGAVGRDLVITANTGTVNGPVVRDVEGSYGLLTVGSSAAIGGGLHYTSDNEATVSGKIAGATRRDPAPQYSGRKADVVQSFIAFAFMALTWLVLIALALQLLFPKKMHTATTLTPRDVALAIALGLIALIVIPIVAVSLIVSVFALPLGIALILAWIALCIVSPGIAAIYVGRVLFKKQNMHPLAATALAAVGLAAISMIPFIGFIVVLGLVSFGTGAVLYAIRGEHQPGVSGPKAKLAKV